jgi:hypothetical protein
MQEIRALERWKVLSAQDPERRPEMRRWAPERLSEG